MENMLEHSLAPHERMAEIRRLVREERCIAGAIEHAREEEDLADLMDVREASDAARKVVDKNRQDYASTIADLLKLLAQAEARGEVGECEGFLSVSYAGRI